MHTLNQLEKFYLPNLFNFQKCKFIRFGDFALIDTLRSNCDDATI